MILVDLSGVGYHTLIDLYKDGGRPELPEVERILIKYIKNLEEYHGPTFGKVIICIDSKPYWRSDIHKGYKQQRKAQQVKTDYNYDQCSQDIGEVASGLHEVVPYDILSVANMEADDLIAVLSLKDEEKILIISSDKDLTQLQQYKQHVYQFSPYRDGLIFHHVVEYNLLEHIAKGDRGDGIPNIFSPLDFFMNPTGARQKSVSEAILAELTEYYPDNLENCPLLENGILERFKENETLVDLREIPKNLVDLVLKHYEAESKREKEDNTDALFSPFEDESEYTETIEQAKKVKL